MILLYSTYEFIAKKRDYSPGVVYRIDRLRDDAGEVHVERHPVLVGAGKKVESDEFLTLITNNLNNANLDTWDTL